MSERRASRETASSGSGKGQQMSPAPPLLLLLLPRARATSRWRPSSRSGSATFRNGKRDLLLIFLGCPPLSFVPFRSLTFYLSLPLSSFPTPLPSLDSYTSFVTLTPPAQVLTTASGSSLFRSLDCRWKFSEGPLPSSTTWVSFSVGFEFRSAVHRHLASVFFDDVVRKMVTAFEGRCAELYGAPSLGRRRRVAVPSSSSSSSSSSSAASEEEEDRGKLPA